jgi:hypothetical protein
MNTVRQIVEEESAKEWLRRQSKLVPALKCAGFKPHGSGWTRIFATRQIYRCIVWFDNGEWCFKLEIQKRGEWKQVGFKAFKTEYELLAYLKAQAFIDK